MRSDRSGLYLKNAAIGLIMVIPLTLLLVFAAGTRDQDAEGPLPFIVLREAAGFGFASGKADPSPELEEALRTTIPHILDSLALRHRADRVEVVGHTDGQHVRAISNLDSLLLLRVAGDSTIQLQPGSNADLGLMRAWAVARMLKESPQLSRLQIVGYSAGDALDTAGGLAPPGDHSDDISRRRIEIWLRRSR